MTKFELEVSAPGKDPGSDAPYKCQTLVLAAQQRLRCLDAFTDSSWVARTIREKEDAVWVVRISSAGVSAGTTMTRQPITCQAAQDIPLDPKVNRDNCRGSATVAW